MQFSLKDLLVVVAFVAVISWCAGQIGPDNASLWIVVTAMTVTAAAFVSAARLREGRWLAPFTAGIALVPFCLTIFSPGVFLYAMMLFAGGCICLFLRQVSTKVLWAFVMVCMATALVVDAREVQGRVRRLEALRQEFPIVSLASRLNYENRDDHTSDPKPNPASAVNDSLSGEVAARLTKFEQDLAENHRRDWELRTIHDGEYEGFVRSMGFGVMRMARPSAESMRRPPLRNIAFNEPSADRTGEYREWNSRTWAGDSNTARHLHAVSRNDFLDPNGFGAIVKPKQAAGFIEHGLHFSPLDGLKDHRAWTIERLELVSLLKFDEPRVYVLDHLPRMDQLSSDDMPTRVLDEFEEESLEKLRTEEDLVVREQNGVHRMLGSLRAAKQCLECHSVERGELLGAFSYALRRGEKGETDAAAGQ